MRRGRGFTLVEIVVALTISIVVAGFIALFVTAPVRSYTDQSRRAELVAAADNALRRVGRDVRAALPNSVRVSAAAGVAALELLETLDGAFYSAGGDPADPNAWLDFTQADAGFRTIGEFPSLVKPFSSTSAYLAIYNVGVPGADAYQLANVITPAGATISVTSHSPGRDQVTLSPGFRFAFASPRQRVFVVGGPVTWLCDTAARTLTRFSGYAIAASQAARDSAAELRAAGAAEAVVAADVTACAFDYSPGTLTRAGLVSSRLEVGRDGERVVLLNQFHVENAP